MKPMLVTLLVLICGMRSEAALQIAANGHARCVIVTQAGATPSEHYAAEELARTLEKITGAHFTIQEGGEKAPPSAILVGQGALAHSLFPAIDFGKLGKEEIVLHSANGRLLLAGGRPRGTLYAVYHFLQDQCGVRWWAPWASTIPHTPTLAIADLTIDAKPAFEYRDPYEFPALNGDWAARNYSNSQFANLDKKHGGQITYNGFVHTFYPLVPPDPYFKEHPEWYSLINGKRTTQAAQLCTTNPELRDFLVARVEERIKENPDASILSVSQNDCFNACQCPICKAIDDAQGSSSGTMLALVNYVAAKVAKDHPEIAIDTLAYQYTRHPPKDIRPLPNVIVRLCSIECNFGAPLDDPSNKSFAADIQDWNRLSDRLYIWDYVTDFAHYELPHPNWFVLGPNMRFFHRHGVRGIFEEGAYQSNGSEMSELRAWLLAQLMWNPEQDDRKLIDSFLTGYYGKQAAPFIRQYMDLIATKAKGFYLTCYNGPGAPFFDFATLSQAEQLWRKAEQAVANSPDLLWRVRQGHLPVRYVFLSRWSQLQRDGLKLGRPWPLPASRHAVAKAWLAEATGPGPVGWTPMTAIREGGGTPASFVNAFATDPPAPSILKAHGPVPPIPVDIPDASAKNGVDIHADRARLYQEGEDAEVRADPKASDGLAIWMPGSHHEWAIQFPFSDLPARVRKGKWKVYAVVRVEKAAGADPDALAFTAGVYDSGANTGRGGTTVKVGDASEGYKSYPVATVDANADQYVWLAPPANSSVKSMWLDRLYFVPE